jgi:isocitrate/isopropylmalate dehydrogenase
MMLRRSFNLEREAEAIEHAINSALGSGVRTADIATRASGWFRRMP